MASVIITMFLFSFIGISDAIVIEEMEPSFGEKEDRSGYLYHTARVETNEPYFMVDWYINDVWKSTTWGADDETEAFFSPLTGNYPGSHNGTDYVIKAIAYSWEGEKDTDNYTVTVYRTFRIVSMYASYGYDVYDFGNGASHTAEVVTSEPYSSIKGVDWYLNDVYHSSTLGNGVKTYAFNDFTGLYGDLKGTKYTITAKAWILEDDGEFFSATKTYTIRAYQPISDDDDDKLPGVYGLARLFRQYYDGANITINCYILAHNKTNNERKASGKFKHEVSGFPVIERNQPEEIMTANGGSYSKSDSLPQPVGTIGPGDRYESVAYVRLVVRPANWFVGTDPENPVTFTDADTP